RGPAFEPRCEPIPFREAESRNIEIVVPATATLAGRLMADEGVPVERLQVLLWNENRGPAGYVGKMGWTFLSLSAGGAFHGKEIEAGRYTLAVATSYDDPDPLLIPNLDVGRDGTV